MNPTPSQSETASADDLSQLFRRIQHALIDGHVVTLNDTLGRLVLAKKDQELPPNPGSEVTYGAREAGVFREVESTRGPATSKRWLHWGALDSLEDTLGPSMRHLSKADVDAIGVGLSFQVVMTQENQARQTRRQRPR